MMSEIETEGSKRASYRVPFAARVSGEGETFFFSDFATDISSTGLGLSSIRTLEPEMEIKLRFQLPDSAEMVEITGKVVWDARVAGKEELGRRSGLQFRDARPGVLERIRDFVEKAAGKDPAAAKS